MSYPVPVSLSPSRVSNFLNCAQAFKFKAIDRLPEPESQAASLGNVVHDALFRLYYEAPGPAWRTGANLDVALEAAFSAAGLGAPEPWEVEENTRQWNVAQGLAANIFQVEDPTQVVPAGCELRLDWPLEGHRSIGIIDRLDVVPGGLCVVDYKTGKVPRERDLATKFQGVMFYAMMLEEMLGVRPVNVKLIYLAKPVTFIAEPTDTTFRGLRVRLRAMWEAIERSCEHESFKPKVGPLCSWCSYQALCPAWRS